METLLSNLKLFGLGIKLNVDDKCNSASQTTDTTIFPKGTTVVLGDSMINQLTNEGLSRKSRNIKVFPHSRATITDIKFELMKILPRKPSDIILHVATNNAVSNTSRQICDDLLFLKFLVKEKLPNLTAFRQVWRYLILEMLSQYIY